MKKPLHILILEDNPNDAELAVRQLEREGFSVKWTRVETEKAFREGLKGNPDLILADYSVPSFSGIEALRVKVERAPDIPFIVISGTIGEEIAVECMKLGAVDYVLKDKLFRLGTAVKRVLEEARIYRERRQADVELRESETKYRALVENLPQKIFLKNRDLTYISCNKNYARDLKIEPEEITGKDDYEFHPGQLAKKYRKDDKRIMESGESEDIEERYLQDGQERWVHTVKTPVRDEAGNVTGVLGIFRDITKMKEAEDKLKEYQEHLEELVKKRTTELEKEIAERKKAESLIKEQNERLKELDRMKSEFLSTAAHELRTPLTSILGFSEILLQKETDEERRNKFLKIINEESQGLAKLINDLLDLSRIESVRGFKITKAPIEIGGIIRENINLFQAQTDKHIFKVNIPDDLVKIEADKDKMNQVIENLISNALKFSPQGGEITVSIEENKDELKVNVSDNGIGILEKDLSHIFEKFYRASNASSEAIGGTGLGLAIVKYIVESHGGRIWAESKLGEGSTFTFTLPVRSRRLRMRRK